jgi:prepilin-type N-terminal cleavage/methylation domain-containing protein
MARSESRLEPPRRVDRESGFTLVEMLIVLGIIGILLAIAVPQYISLTDPANEAVAKTNIKSVALVAEVYYSDNDGTAGDADGKAGTQGYKGMTMGILRRYNPALPASLSFKGKPKTGSYCVRTNHGGTWWSAQGPGVAAGSFKNNKKCK